MFIILLFTGEYIPKYFKEMYKSTGNPLPMYRNNSWTEIGFMFLAVTNACFFMVVGAFTYICLINAVYGVTTIENSSIFIKNEPRIKEK